MGPKCRGKLFSHPLILFYSAQKHLYNNISAKKCFAYITVINITRNKDVMKKEKKSHTKYENFTSYVFHVVIKLYNFV